MLKNVSIVLFIALLPGFVFSGCSDETVVPTENNQAAVTTLVEGDIDPDGGGFEYIVDSAGEGTDRPGPFAILGSNIHYVDSLHVLSVDFRVENRGTIDHFEPVTLAFVRLMPDTVEVENPDNGEHGAGAMIRFQFENRDNVWTAGETSLPRTVLFEVGEGESIGFVARIDVGMDESGGSIGGLVWHDVDENGELDDGENGVGGVEIYLTMEDDPEPSASPAATWRTVSAGDGTYRFDGLDAGHYTVSKGMDQSFRPTTPTEIEVILVESGGEVSDFLLANFGCVPAMGTDRIEIGDWVSVNGDFFADPDRIMARGIDVVRCDVPPPPPDTIPDLSVAMFDGDGNGDDRDWDDCDECEHWGCWGLKNELRGPVTGVNRDENALEIMGVWVHFDMLPDTVVTDSLTSVASGGDGHKPKSKWLDPDDVNVGDRVRARAIRWQDDDRLYGFFLKEWKGTPEKVFGRVEVVSAPSGPIDYITVLGLDVIITARTEIHFKQ
jgi:hypothetical protein